MPKRGRRRKKTRTHTAENEAAQSALVEKAEEKVPKTLVIRRGKTAAEVGELVDDLRHLLLPFTALHFKEDPKNRKLTLPQYAQHLALPMGITHMLAFSQSSEHLNLRVARTPEGPTLTFRVPQFSLNRHIKSLQKRPVAITPALIASPPIVVVNNFGSSAPHVKLMRLTFQNMFPSINVATVRLRDCRRVALFNLVEETDAEGQTHQMVDVRHYAIRATPASANRRVRRLVTAKKLPNLSRCNDIAEYLSGALSDGGASDSEAEEEDQVVLGQSYVGKGNIAKQKSALKLTELGPRLSLELLKVEKGLGAGDVLYHSIENKTPEEAAALKARKERERELKQQRRAQQEANVERKRQAAEEKRAAKKQRQEERVEATGAVANVPEESDGSDSESTGASDEE